METINNIELRDETINPNEEVLRSTLENSFDSYVLLLELFKNIDILYEWRY